MIRISKTSSIVALAIAVGLPPARPHAQTQGTSAQVASAQGSAVRVTTTKGVIYKGKLVSLSALAVVVRTQGKEATWPLDEVRRIEKVSHGVRNGAIIGALGGLLLGARAASQCPCESVPAFYYLAGPVGGAGYAAAVGAIINRATRGRHRLYASPAPSRSVTIEPAFTPQRAAVSMAIRW